MSRWQPDAHQRLETSALELFSEIGYADTTVPQIAGRAGLTNRTFYRYFQDKREVLFAAENQFPAGISRIMAGAPAAADPWELMAYGLTAAASQFFPGRRDYFRLRRDIIRSDAGLQERELAKQADMAHAIRDGFLSRGFDEPLSTMAAHLCAIAMQDAIERWTQDETDQPLADHVSNSLATMRVIAGGPAIT